MRHYWEVLSLRETNGQPMWVKLHQHVGNPTTRDLYVLDVQGTQGYLYVDFELN